MVLSVMSQQRWIPLKVGGHVQLRMDFNNADDPLTFQLAPSPSQLIPINLSCTLCQVFITKY